MSIRYKHHHFSNGNILTIITSLNKDNREGKVGYYFNTNDIWKRKECNKLALKSLEENNFYFILSDIEKIQTDYITLRSLEVIYFSLIMDNINNYELIDHFEYAINKAIYTLKCRVRV